MIIASNYYVFGRDYGSNPEPTDEIIATDGATTLVGMGGGFLDEGNIFTGDTFNGEPVVPGDVTLNIISADPDITVDPLTGNITATLSFEGDYPIEYEICQNGVCSTATKTLTFYSGVVKSVIASPLSACFDANTTINLVGEGFLDVASVTLDGIPTASFTVDDYFNMSFVVPDGLTVGEDYQIEVENFTGIAYNTSADITIQALPVVAELVGTDTEVCIGSTIQYVPAGGGQFSSRNESVATVDTEGVITGVSEGTVIIDYCVTDLGCTKCVQTPEIEVFKVLTSLVGGGNKYAIDGQVVTFDPQFEGAYDTLQWELSEDFGDTYTPLVNNATYSGVNTEVLTVVADSSMVEFNYGVSAVTPCGNFSAADLVNFVLFVGDVGVLTEPENFVYCLDNPQDLTFSIVANGDVQDVSWQVSFGGGFVTLADGVQTLNSLGAIVTGSNTENLNIEITSGDTAFLQGWIFRAVIQGTIDTAYSKVVSLSVQADCTP